MIDPGGQSEIVLVRNLFSELVMVEQDAEWMKTNHLLDILRSVYSAVYKIDSNGKRNGACQTHEKHEE